MRLAAAATMFTILCASSLDADETTPRSKPTELLMHEDFSAGLDRWWVEGGQKVWVEEGRLHVRADPADGNDAGHVATVWCREPIAGDVRVQFDARVISSRGDSNNINFFLLYSDPQGRPLEETADERADADYGHYHDLNGYIFTFLNSRHEDAGPDGPPARIRIRRCPSFTLLAEHYAYHCRAGHTYRFEIVRQKSTLSIHVDGQKLLEANDPHPHTAGLIGLRTFRTELWWDNIRVERIEPTE